MTENVEVCEFRLCLQQAFERVSLEGVCLAYYEPDTTLTAFQLNHQSWEELPLAYFERMGADSIWLAEGRKFLFVLPSAMTHTINDWSVGNVVPDLGFTLVARLLNIACASIGSADFHCRRILTVFQSHTIFLYLRIVAAVDHSVAEDASRAMGAYWGRFRDC